MQDSQSLIAVFGQVIERLERSQIAYMVVGSIASLVYGEPRLTKDLDLVLALHPRDLLKLEQLFAGEDYYCPPIEVMTDELLRQGQCNLIHPASGLKVDLIFRKNSEHSLEEFDRRRSILLWEGLVAQVASPEDVILKKLDYFREGQSQKHLQDIRGILALTPVDEVYLRGGVTRLGLAKEWALVS